MSRSIGKGTALRSQMSRVNSRSSLAASFDTTSNQVPLSATELPGLPSPPQRPILKKIRDVVRRQLISNPDTLRRWSVKVFVVGIVIVLVLIVVEVKGAKRWLGRWRKPGLDVGSALWENADRPSRYGVLDEKGPWLIGLVTDLDRESWRAATNESDERWVSYFKRGELVLGKEPGVRWIDEVMLESRKNEGKRGMELSDLVWFRGKLVTADDRTGVVYEIVAPRGGLEGEIRYKSESLLDKGSSKVVKRLTLVDGNGDGYHAFKAEWMTVKDGNLYVGSHGRELTNPPTGSIKSFNPMWIKVIDQDMRVKHQNWTEPYNKMRDAAQCPFPGYMMHEGALWSAHRRQWVFFPRRWSRTAYDPVKNERSGWNSIILADDTFSKIAVVPIKFPAGDFSRHVFDRGFSSAKFIPGSKDSKVVAIRTIERESVKPKETESFITVFDVNSGDIILPETLFSKRKFEGIEFL
eukprot:Plantae.Rhodophyta-Hildenbrandia_rubra.ctg5703.p2 GENE.Plantae.Rhodophyta-Hildenbrandia_rubra.ctg5703~~Plantae.Rhodophyta-Hildenbrandia_rubra.ctg5703.p2  ORF type:complete len:466 (-),score=65.40 Plantae.Rhodophyta-Hildenbrandia_rubra.ctg5703:690-2087(-)